MTRYESHLGSFDSRYLPFSGSVSPMLEERMRERDLIERRDQTRPKWGPQTRAVGIELAADFHRLSISARLAARTSPRAC